MSSPVPTGALWALVPLCVLLVTVLALMYRRQARLSRERANAVQSRDRANIDLQMIIHRTSAEGKLEPSRRPASSEGKVSLPPGPPSSSPGDSVAAQEEELRSAAPSSWRAPPLTGGSAGRKRRAERDEAASSCGSTLSGAVRMVPAPPVGPQLTVPAPPVVLQLNDALWLTNVPWAPPVTPYFVPGQTSSASASASSSSAPPAAPAPAPLAPTPLAPAPLAPAPQAKKGLANAYINFCKEQRPLLPPGLSNAAREALLGQRWKAFSDAKKSKYQTGGTAYYEFCCEQRPLLPPGLRNADREALLGERWRALSQAEKASRAGIALPDVKTPRVNPYTAFCKEQRPLLPPELRNAEREALLGQRWRTLSVAEKAPYKFARVDPRVATAPAPALQAHHLAAPSSASPPLPAPLPTPLPAPLPRRQPAPPPPPLMRSPPAPPAPIAPPAPPAQRVAPIRPAAPALPAALTPPAALNPLPAAPLQLHELLTQALEEMTGEEATDMLVTLGV